MEILCISGDGVCQGAFHMVPDQLIGIEFWSIRRQQMWVQPRMPAQEVADNSGAMGEAPVPEQNDVAAYVPEEVPEKADNLRSANVLLWMKLTIQPETVTSGRDRESRDRRDFAPCSCRCEDRRLSPWGPCA